WDSFYCGCKQKLDTIRGLCGELNFTMEQTAYIGDGKYDLEVLPHVGLSVCPADAIQEARLLADVVLQKPGGAGCVWELLSILEADRQPGNPIRYFNERMAEHQLIFKKMASDHVLAGKIMAVGQSITERMGEGGQLFLCGNGGSAADAQHIAAEFVGRFYRERPALRAEALTTNSSILTAIGNDYGYERIFVRQLEAKAEKGDVLIGLSTSGSSNNVLEALRYGKKMGLTTVMLTGGHYPPELEELCDFVLNVPSEITPRIQEAHIFLGHLWAEFVEANLFEKEG
ncbi:MAG: SIS domain-containing protein, partial [Lachnospiraceae bacterium]|nr:SIS domain-containing protein [Lachnospiraceae bacterium]